MELKAFIVKVFNAFYKKSYKEFFKLDLEKNNQDKKIDNFIKRLDKKYGIESIGYNFIFNYIAYQFHYWSRLNPNRKIKLDWITGTKAFERWNSKLDNWPELIRRYCNSLDISKNNVIPREESENKTVEVEEREKRRFKNTWEGFYNCINYTLLYNPKSIECLSCHFKKDCKKLKEENEELST